MSAHFSHGPKDEPKEIVKELDDAAMKSVDDALSEFMEKNRTSAELLAKRVRRSKRIMFWSFIVMVFASVIATAGLYAYFNWQKYVTDYDRLGMDTRACIFKVGDRTITGTRTYTYRYMTVLGHRIFMTPEAEVEHETRIDIDGKGMSIVMNTAGEKHKTKIIGDGEKYRQFIDRADTYTFFMDGGKSTAVLAYGEICK
mgnify:CR=1 FL=1